MSLTWCLGFFRLGGGWCCDGWVVVVLGAAAVLFTSGMSAQKRFWVDP
jgi:hypothetical protein